MIYHVKFSEEKVYLKMSHLRQNLKDEWELGDE
jgi:hypothetical protein